MYMLWWLGGFKNEKLNIKDNHLVVPEIGGHQWSPNRIQFRDALDVERFAAISASGTNCYYAIGIEGKTRKPLNEVENNILQPIACSKFSLSFNLRANEYQHLVSCISLVYRF